MTADQKEVLRFKDYPEGSGGKEIYDEYFMNFKDYLIKYYFNLEKMQKISWEYWLQWYQRCIEPAFDENRHDEMIKNYGYVDKKYYDFHIQNETYMKLKQTGKIPDEINKFIGFMAGTGFFKRYNISVEQWLNMKNWQNPYVENDNGKTINEILSYKYGINYLKVLLPQMPYWDR